MEQFDKDPDAVLDYAIEWDDWLNSETISVSAWTVPTGITEDSNSIVTTATVIWLSGGTIGQSYTLVNHITTTAGREEDRTIIISVVER